MPTPTASGLVHSEDQMCPDCYHFVDLIYDSGGTLIVWQCPKCGRTSNECKVKRTVEILT